MTNNSPELVRASLEGDLATVQRLIEAGADVNSADENGIGPLLTFTPAITAYLLSHGADPNLQTNEDGAPVLAGVAYMNKPDCVRLLLEAGADADFAGQTSGETALHCILCKPDGDKRTVVELLLKHRANPNRQTIPGVPTQSFWRDVRTRGETPLHRAAAYADKETIRVLFDAGAHKTLRDANGDSPQSWASWHWRSKPLIDLLHPHEGR